MLVFLARLPGARPGQVEVETSPGRGSGARRRRRTPTCRWWRRLLPVAVSRRVVAAPLLLGGLWEGIVAKGVALAILFLSYTIVTGEGGMMSLCQITLAGLAAALGRRARHEHGLAVGVAIPWAALAVPIGLVAALQPPARRPLPRARDARVRAAHRELVLRAAVGQQLRPGRRPCPRPRASATTCPSTTCSSVVFCVVAVLVPTSSARRPVWSSTRRARARRRRPRSASASSDRSSSCSA